MIIGPDLVWRNDRWVARPGRSHDSQVKRASAEDFDRAVRNTYKVLLTRGMRGPSLLDRRRDSGHAARSRPGRQGDRAVNDLIALRDGMRAFTKERGWEAYHDPKSLILALVGEVGS